MFARLVFFLLIWSVALTVQARENSASAPDFDATHRTSITLPDVTVKDSENREHRLAQLLQGRIAVVNFVFTSCTTVCPVLSATLQQVEERLRDRLGKDVILLSLSVDPGRDTPEKLHAHAGKLGAGPHWYWLTGNPAEFNRLLRAFGIPSGRPEDHPPVILVGNFDKNHWLRWVGVAAPDTLVEAVNVLASSDL